MLQALPAHALRQTTDDDGIATRIYQLEARHKTFAQPLNVVVIVKTNQQHPAPGARPALQQRSGVALCPTDRLLRPCGSSWSSTFAMPNSTGAWRISCRPRRPP